MFWNKRTKLLNLSCYWLDQKHTGLVSGWNLPSVLLDILNTFILTVANKYNANAVNDDSVLFKEMKDGSYCKTVVNDSHLVGLRYIFNSFIVIVIVIHIILHYITLQLGYRGRNLIPILTITHIIIIINYIYLYKYFNNTWMCKNLKICYRYINHLK